MKIPVSVVVLTKNEATGIAATLSRLTEFDEVIVSDSNSTDGTVQIAEQHGSRVVNFTWDQGYPKKKQWSLDNCDAKYDWVLLLDADEYPSEDLIHEIRRLSRDGFPEGHSAYDLTLEYKFAGRFLKYGHKVVKRSLINRQHTRFPVVNDADAPGIREVEGHYQPETDGSVSKLAGPLMHDDMDPVTSWFDRHNRYSDWEAHLVVHPELRERVIEKRSRQGRLFANAPFKPLAFFLYGYVIRAGMLDGRAGFDYHIAQAAYYWQIGVKARELQRNRD